MFNIDNGDNVVIKVVGKKVAFSCIGLVDSLNGEPETDIIVEAVGIRNIVENSTVQCTQLQEQSTSEIDGSFRILGLLPDCQYVIRLKTDHMKNKNISKSIPKAHSVRVQNRDISDLRFIVIYKSLQTDLTLSIETKEEYLNTISIKLFRSNEPNAMFQQTLHNSFVFLPSVPLDNATYLLKVDSNLDDRTYQYEPIIHTILANESYLHLHLDFPVQRRHQHDGTSDQDIAHNSLYSLILFLIGMAIYNYRQVLEFYHKTPINVTNIRQIFTNNSSLSNNNDNTSDGSHSSSNNNNNKKKMKFKKN
ncbi:hypothetical protein BLA29_007279 [Euroglyphus maynei]|uniref:NOMO C-terminal transthyretin-like domain-containing protein n=1 Tax=Euroglyphus maynei TaxID=6958 RepID=A0A1Y3AWU0_EURMA|nr:hypothetical protein BLA29_007279 [Euroglyphus maynei]